MALSDLVYTGFQCGICRQAFSNSPALKEHYEKHSYDVPKVLNDNISRRDYFAALAMQGLLANSLIAQAFARKYDTYCAEPVAREALEYADALIAELDKKV